MAPTPTPRVAVLGCALLGMIASLQAARGGESGASPSTSVPRSGAAPADPVLGVMEAELERSLAKLKSAEKVPLYYFAYQITDSIGYHVNASLGALESESENVERYLDVEVRVGSRRMDNTHELKGQGAQWLNYRGERKVKIPVEDDVDALRTALWLETDKAYKDAQERYTKVLMNRAVTAEEEDKSDDFSSAERPQKFQEPTVPSPIRKELWKERLRKFSLKFKDQPFIFNSGVSFNTSTSDRRLATSEGTRLRSGNNYLRLSYQLSTRTQDGMDLSRFHSYDGEKEEDFPPEEKVLADMERSIRELKALKDAPLVEPYTGPAIIKNRATGVFFHEILGHRMEGHRQKSEHEGQTFTKKLGEKIVTEFISVYDDPTLRRFKGTFLRGFYKFDDEGVPAQRVTLVEKGVLKGFLMNRVPITAFKDSNGHGRREPGHPIVARMGNTIVEASGRVPYEELRKKLVEEIVKQGKPYGLVFDDIAGGFTMTGRDSVQSFKVIPLLVYRVYPDARPDEAVRGVDIVGTPLTSFTKILAAADDADIFNGSCGAESGWVPVSGVAPSILVSEIEVEKQQKSQAKPPVLPPPFHEK